MMFHSISYSLSLLCHTLLLTLISLTFITLSLLRAKRDYVKKLEQRQESKHKQLVMQSEYDDDYDDRFDEPVNFSKCLVCLVVYIYTIMAREREWCVLQN